MENKIKICSIILAIPILAWAAGSATPASARPVVRWGNIQAVTPVPTCIPTPTPDPRIETIRAFLENHNPQVSWLAENFVEACDAVDVDPFLVVAIGSLESGYFRHGVGGNFYGHMGQNGYIRYETYAEGIYKACELLSRPLYAGKSVEAIGKIYAADPAWSQKVQTIYAEITKGEK